ncbi:hypothetical protein HMPREF1544_02467 [Mucor circinelloides 1006PhL]|uniref:BZIP domain-containing protein n=1 Tax=Mucor circinelloides f. circinelloides (strain 1006PhL) TaxID=1220926 RepID=S2JQD3_MUCC1|nr:hypothetical protein HMPREF1544_02467 [Mucor circinelloides 1006PhL]
MTALGEHHANFHANVADITPQVVAWDQIKILTRILAQSCSRRQSEWRRRRLQSKQNKMLRIYIATQVRNERLPKVESMISNLQQELSDIQALRAAVMNRQRAIPTLIHPTTSTTCKSTVANQAAPVAFYEKLYTADDAMDHKAIHYFFTN